MKTIIKKIIVLSTLALLLFTTSCDSFLDRQQDQALDMNTVWSKRETTYRMWLQTMSYMPNEFGSYQDVVQTGASDEATIAYDRGYRALNFGTWNPNYAPGLRFTDSYKGIRDCNLFLANVDKCTDPTLTDNERKLWKIQTRFVRAYYYFLMLRDYGPIMLVGDEIIDFNLSLKDLERERNTWDECVDYVVSELEGCATSPDMPIKARNDSELGLATKGACYAVISRLQLYSARPLFNGNTLYSTVKNSQGVHLFPQNYSANKWKISIEAAKKVIDLDIYELHVDPSNDPFKSLEGIVKTQWNKELIFSNAGNVGLFNIGAICTPTALSGTAWGGVGPTQQQVDAYAMESGKYPITGYYSDGRPIIDATSGYLETGKSKFSNPAFKSNSEGSEYAPITSNQQWPNMYKNREPRFYAHVFWSDSYWQHGSDNSNFTLISFAKGGNGNKTHDYPKSGYLMHKYYRHELNSQNGAWGRACFPTFRFGETYLNFIESVLEYNQSTGDGTYLAKAMEYWDLLRERAGMPPILVSYPEASNKDLIELIRMERRIELAFELHRYYDTRTWKIAEKTDDGPMYGMNVSEPTTNPSQTPAGFWKRTVFETRVFLPKHYLYPFHQSELDRNKKIVQNYGW